MDYKKLIIWSIIFTITINLVFALYSESEGIFLNVSLKKQELYREYILLENPLDNQIISWGTPVKGGKHGELIVSVFKFRGEQEELIKYYEKVALNKGWQVINIEKGNLNSQEMVLKKNGIFLTIKAFPRPNEDSIYGECTGSLRLYSIE
ncbi:MAG TPA: hypothetical protein IAB06_03525 [Candidatus Avacidaminococcus intestinavium]|uniref:Uncharacterized protein n=1 Tax=Candidatus Avacidaminococcus intestinavium TaxID=2840684 RepID=A0A9D1MPM1_9FIRM|nr:hypothetical protein [Candidatus Avacidaminococcus intestinavium]